MTQADRDRLVTLRKAKKRLITQQQAAEELRLSVRQVKRSIAPMCSRHLTNLARIYRIPVGSGPGPKKRAGRKHAYSSSRRVPAG